MTFKELGLSDKVLTAVEEAGYTEPTPIQAQAIPNVLSGRDVLGIAQTGTGKTAGFTLPMIDRLSRGRAKARMPRSLILEPTRELAAQVAESFEVYGKNNKLSMALLIGGVSFGDQEKKLDRGVDVLIATPGRLLDHCERGKVMLNGVQILVIDEADRMLDMGFIPDIENICKRIPFTRQTLFFSATMPPEIQRLSDAFLQNPVRIEVARQSTMAETITSRLCRSGSKPFEKRETLRQIIRAQDNLKNGIIFCNRKRDVDTLARSLNKHGFDAAPLHGDLDQRVRTATLGDFKAGKLKFLVASDVAARGLDIPDVSHVFNFDVPTHAEDYVHRIGRTGRAGRDGFAFTICTKAEGKYVAAIEELTKKKIEEIDFSGGKKAEASKEASKPDSKADAQAETTEASEEKPKRTRRRRNKAESAEGDEKPARAQKADKPKAEKQKAADKPARAPRRDDKPAEKRETRKPKTEGTRAAHPEPKKPRRKSSDDEVIGLGDHVPAFLQRPIPRI